jgi:hypothetical protein
MDRSDKGDSLAMAIVIVVMARVTTRIKSWSKTNGGQNDPV